MQPNADVDEEEYVTKLTKNLQKAFQISKINQQRLRLRHKKNYDAKHYQVNYEVGDWVFKHRPRTSVGLATKLIPQWEGPYLIIKKLSSVNYQIYDTDNERVDSVHVQHLANILQVIGIQILYRTPRLKQPRIKLNNSYANLKFYQT